MSKRKNSKGDARSSTAPEDELLEFFAEEDVDESGLRKPPENYVGLAKHVERFYDRGVLAIGANVLGQKIHVRMFDSSQDAKDERVRMFCKYVTLTRAVDLVKLKKVARLSSSE